MLPVFVLLALAKDDNSGRMGYHNKSMPNSKYDEQLHIETLLEQMRSESEVTRQSRIYCNRNLRMESIEWIGFDMDYTLAIYNQQSMEKLSIQLTLDKLVKDKGYPSDICDLHYDTNYAIRGLVIDRQLGNVFKMDRHRHVGRVYHGFRLLTLEERKKQYRNSVINLSDDRYAWIDTLFGLPEAVMYITLVDYFERTNKNRQSYAQLWDDIRSSIDRAHADQSLKSTICADLEDFLIKDSSLAETLHKLRSSGKKLFLLTNSYYEYTNALMTYLLDGELKAYPSWKKYFEVIVVGGKKPGFFTKKQPFVAVDSETGQLLDTPVKELERGVAYQGGNLLDFERMTHCAGERVLYVGDHIYGDILKLKKSHVWRTTMVIQELEAEYDVGRSMEQHERDLELLDRRRRNLASEIDYQTMILKKVDKLLVDTNESEMEERLQQIKRQVRTTLSSLRDRESIMQQEVDALESSIDRAYNPYWGSMIREGNESSRFGEQVNDYADLYTSRVSNFRLYSPLRYFRGARAKMPHES